MTLRLFTEGCEVRRDKVIKHAGGGEESATADFFKALLILLVLLSLVHSIRYCKQNLV
jgi:hypothetical protein